MSSGSRNYLTDVQKKRRTRRRILRLALGGIILGSIIYGATWLLFRSSLLSIRTVQFEGNRQVTEGEIQELIDHAIARNRGWMHVFPMRRMFVWPNQLTDDDLAFLPRMKRVTIEKNYVSQSIVVHVVERVPVGIWCSRSASQTDVDFTLTNADNAQTVTEQAQNSGEKVSVSPRLPRAESRGPVSEVSAPPLGGGQRQSASSPRWSATSPEAKCFWFDEEGVLFERAPQATGSLIPVVDDYAEKDLALRSMILPQRFIASMQSILKVLAASNVSVQEIRVEDLGLEEVKVTTFDGPELYFSLRFPADNALPVIQSIFAQSNASASVPVKNLKYIDFRVENRAYYQ